MILTMLHTHTVHGSRMIGVFQNHQTSIAHRPLVNQTFVASLGLVLTLMAMVMIKIVKEILMMILTTRW